MAGEAGRRDFALACEHQVGERLMGGEEALRFAEAVHHHAAVAVGLEVEVVVERQQAFRPAGGDQRAVERLVATVERLGSLGQAVG